MVNEVRILGREVSVGLPCPAYSVLYWEAWKSDLEDVLDCVQLEEVVQEIFIPAHVVMLYELKYLSGCVRASVLELLLWDWHVVGICWNP